jgi:hypothetical protein
MKALALTAYGQPPQWIELPQPVPAANQVVVKISATAVNPLDTMIARGEFKQFFSYKLPQPLGNEFAGTVTAVGEGVTKFAIGQEVYARPDINQMGSFAEYIAVDERDLAHKPSNLSMEEAASLPLVLLTAIQAFTEKRTVKPSTKVFIQGGTGGLGSIAIQVAKHLGAIVATTVSTANVDLAAQLGADTVIDYRTQNYEEHLNGYDVVLDTLGGDETTRAMKVLAPGGTLISVVSAPDPSFAQQIGKPFLRPVMWWLSRSQRKAAKALGLNYSFLFMRANGEQLAAFAPAIESSAIRPVIGHTFSFEQLPEALELLGSGRSNPGKIVITVGENS